VVGLRLVLTASALLAVVGVGLAGAPAALPALAFEDQEGHTLDLESLRGRVVVIVYGTRDGLDHHAEWGRRLHGELIGGGLYRSSDPPEGRPVRILALAQMGGIPPTFRPVIRAFVRGHVPAGFSLYLDWEDRMSRLFGAHRALSTVVVSDRDGTVRLVTTGLPREDTLRGVVEAVRRLA
jgi:hypothetical protein